MDPFDLLNNHKEDIELPDIEMIRIALETGPYNAKDREKGMKLLNEVYQRLTTPNPEKEQPVAESAPISQEVEKLSSAPLSDEQVRKIVKTRLGIIRVSSSTLALGVRSLLNSFGDRAPLDVFCLCADLFSATEISSVLSWLNLGEENLAKYWAILNKGDIARYQLFSEDFYILHFNDLNVNIVLKQGKNPWRKKDAMSPKLTMFLKLKGVSL